MSWRIRRATVADAEAWADCHRACWQEAYGPIVDPALLAARLADRDAWVRRVADRLAQPRPAQWLAVADTGEAIGLAVAGPSRDDVADHAPEQLYAVYVRAAWHGHGVGQALLDRAIGTAAACLEVLEDNGRAQAFYARNGFAPTGVRKKFEPFDVWEIVMARPSGHSIRPATPDDVAFLTDVAIEATRAQGRLPEDFDEDDYRAGFGEWTEEQVRGEIPGSTTSVVEVDGEPVGRLRVVRTEDAVELAGIQLLPAYQGRGIGGSILRALAAEADASGRPLTLSVEKDNPRARAFYEAYGMVQVGETDSEDVLQIIQLTP
ncbi:MAG TPA: GNAT family N-acetyltransferase [Nocardioides sp.]|nr:GNAT family N-acetyltransferase [Nocardioides sp.]